jgi:hypothetical protein
MIEVLAPPTRGFRLWYAVLGGIGWWMVHILGIAGLARARCLHPSIVWAMHGLTVGTVALTTIAVIWSAGVWRHSNGGPEEGAEPSGRLLFLGRFGVLVGAVSILLIVWEGAYVPWLRGCGA